MTHAEASGDNAPSRAVSPKNALTWSGKLSGFLPAALRALDMPAILMPSVALGVAHGDKPESIPFLRRGDAASRQIGGPEGIASTFQVSTNSGEPFKSTASRNLFSKEHCRLALLDELEPSGPQVTVVVCSAAMAKA